MDYSFFDVLIDSVFVIDEARRIVYCNTSAAAFSESSVRRLTRPNDGPRIFDVLSLSDPDLFAMEHGTKGKDSAAPLTEISFTNKLNQKTGKIQIAIQPFAEVSGERRWVILIRDVTLEEVLHGKYRAELEQKEGYILELRQAQGELEKYSKNLEKMVEERTLQVQKANQMLNAIMNSLGQGFLVFDQEGTCGSIFTKACIDILESNPAEQKIWDVLKTPENEKPQFVKWLQATFQEALPFDNMIELAPRTFSHSQKRHITIDYFPLRTPTGEISQIVLVATDRTVEFEAGIALEKEKQNAQMFLRIIRSRDQFAAFLNSSRATLDKLKTTVQDRKIEDLDVQDIFRVLHTLEGESAVYSIGAIRSSARSAQQVLEPLRNGEKVDPVQTHKAILRATLELDQQFQAFVLENRDFFEVIGIDKGKTIEIPYSKILSFQQRLEKSQVPPEVAADFENDFMRVPVKNCLRHLEEAAQVVAAKQSKLLHPIQFDTAAVHIIVNGYEDLFASLVHAVRNAIDHGLEDPQDRLAAGKPERGLIVIRAQWMVRDGGRWLKLEIQDDGRGINASRVRERLQQRFPKGSWADQSDNEIIQHVFDPGLSTRDEVGEFSGRGVGMDAILTEARRMGGDAIVESILGGGTKLVIEVPDQSSLLSYRVGA